MNKDALINWLKAQQPVLEKLLLKSAEEYYLKHVSHRNFEFCAKEAFKELWLLNNGKDLCYDRPSIGFSYSLWYHPKRINTFLRYFTDLIFDSHKESNIEIFDLGAGTGAVLWAVGLIAQGLKVLNLPCPRIRVVNIDTSPFMIGYNYYFLWSNFIKEYPTVREISRPEDYRLNSWSNANSESCNNIWLCASYLFDHSDNATEITSDFKKIIETYKPNKIILLSSYHKKNYCDSVCKEISKLNFTSYSQKIEKQLFDGPLDQLRNFREQISQKHNLNLKGTPTWDIDSLYGIVLVNKAPILNLYFNNNLQLFVKPAADRTTIRLSRQQHDAAIDYGRPTLVIGPAGCGKSVVLTQKIKNILDSSKIDDEYDPKLKILLTTFNKELIKSLGDWVEQLLEKGKYKRLFDNYDNRQSSHSYIQFSNSNYYNIYILHFDILPTKIGRLFSLKTNDSLNTVDTFHLKRMEVAITNYCRIQTIDPTSYDKILDPHFLLDEYHRIVYGYECNTEAQYQIIERKGRGNLPQLRFNSKRRNIVWGIIRIYLQNLREDNYESFIIRRHRFIRKLRKEKYDAKFSHILVDEFQDCTKADYEIFYKLLHNPNNLTLAGDIAQSIHLGMALHIPRPDDSGMGNFSRKNLEGSFRLPFRVSECIQPLSKLINQKFGNREGLQANIISPYKGAPPGSRPVLIYANDTNDAAMKIYEIYQAFRKSLSLDKYKVTVYERDQPLINALNSLNTPCEHEIILRTKGMEKHCVIWSTRTYIDSKNEKEEFIYTILTRTVSLLIIVLFPDIQNLYSKIIKSFVSDRLMRWDQESENKYNELVGSTETTELEEDLDNSDENIIYNDDSIDAYL